MSSFHSPQGLAEHYAPFTKQEALVESHRCLYCYDAPCMHACPTHIDIPTFIKKISTGNVTGSARTIFDANLMGASCARVCPVEELCEGACVLHESLKRPVRIGRLQRYAMDHAYANGQLPSVRASNGKTAAVIGSGPAGLSCAGELARRGWTVTVFEKRPLAGGLSTYGIIGLREPVAVAQAEAAMIEQLGVKIENNRELGGNLDWERDVQGKFDAVFLAVGLGATPGLGIPGEHLILDGLEYIEQSKISPGAMKIGKSVVVIGAGNTAIDCATIARRLGAESVTIVYRRTDREMTAYPHEYAFIKNEGVKFEFLTTPTAVIEGRGLQCIRMELTGHPDATGRPTPVPIPGSDFVIPADQIVKAIGQLKPSLASRLKLDAVNGYIAVSDTLETSIKGVWAGGDAIRAKGAASTVMAVADGKLAAAAIDKGVANRG